jgi:hypothetical protein
VKIIRSSTDITHVALAITIAATLLVWKTTKVAAFNPRPHLPVFGLIAVDPNESMRLSATCPNVTANGASPTACMVRMGFADTHRNTIKQSSYAVNPGDSASLDLRANEVTFVYRTEIQPSVTASFGGGEPQGVRRSVRED